MDHSEIVLEYFWKDCKQSPYIEKWKRSCRCMNCTYEDFGIITTQVRYKPTITDLKSIWGVTELDWLLCHIYGIYFK